MTNSHADSAAPRPASILRLLFVTVGVASLVLGYIGLDGYTASAAHRSFSHAPSDLVYFDLELFLLQSTPIAQGGPYPLALAIARFSAPSVALYAVAELVVAIFARRVWHAWLRRSRGHAVVFGRTRAASVVIERLRAGGMKVLAVSPDARGPHAEADDRWTIVGDPVSRRTLADAAVRHASVVYACCVADSLARAVHQRYLAERLAAGQAWHETAAMARWENLPAELRRANREQAEDAGCKLASIRCLLTPLRASLEPFAFRPDEIEAPAEAEHARWTAERERGGWRHGRHHDEAARLHPGLVPWAELPEDQREKDRRAIRALPDLLTDVGLGVVRVPGDEGALPRVPAAP
jgi:hypothetical protein